MGPRSVALSLATVIASSAVAIADSRTLRGVVTEHGSPTPIAGATVLTHDGAVAVTDLDGYFVLAITEADRELTVAAAGFAARTLRVPADDGVLRIELRRTSGAEVIEVTGRAPEQTKPLSYQLTGDEIRTIPGAGNDILRALQILPGVARIPYSFGGLVLRGTSPRDTAVYLDGIEVPIAFHFGGITSVYPSTMLDDLQLTSGGHGVAHGRAQGGLVTLSTRAPRTDRWRVGGTVGLLDSAVQFEGPLPGGGGVIAGLRRSYLDTVVSPFVDDDFPLPSYWDYQLRTSWGDPRRRGRFTPMAFGSVDQIVSSEVTLTSTFVRVAVPYDRQWGATSLRVVPWFGTNVLVFEDKIEDETYYRPSYPGGVRAELVRDARWGHVAGGLELNGGYVGRTEIAIGGDDALLGGSTIMWADLALWTETRLLLDGDRFAVRPGVRVEAYGLTGELVVDPRVAIHQRLTEDITLRQTIGRYHQPPTPGDVDPENGNPALDSSYVDQLSLGVDARLPYDVTASLTGFYSHGANLSVRVPDPRSGGDHVDAPVGGLGPTFELLLEKQLGFAQYRENVGRGRSLGSELMIKRNAGPWFGMLAYTLAIAERTDDPRSTEVAGRGTSWRPFELDQRHNLQLALSRQVGAWRFGARFQYVSGNPYSPFRVVDGRLEQQPWGGRLPPFVSFDVRADRRWRRSWAHINLYIDIQNVTNRRNVEGREVDHELRAERDVRGLPIVPFIGVEFLPVP